MRFAPSLVVATLFTVLALLGVPSSATSQTSSQMPSGAPVVRAFADLPDAPDAEPLDSQATSSSTSQQDTKKTARESTTPAGTKPPPQPKRILGLMPNYRAVSAGVMPPPPTPREAFKIATLNSFDYSSYAFVGITSLLAEGFDDHPQLGKGVPGFARYYWRGFVDKTDGNYWVIWALPSVTHEDERYYAKGVGSIWDRGIYAASRVLITPNYHGKNTFNASEIVGRGIANAISLTYYPSQAQTLGAFSEKYAYAVGRDALTNTFREFWPDINAHLIHRRHSASLQSR